MRSPRAREHGGAVSRVDELLLLPRPRRAARDDAAVDDVHQRVRAEAVRDLDDADDRVGAALEQQAHARVDVLGAAERRRRLEEHDDVGRELGDRVTDDVEHRRVVRRELRRAAQDLDPRGRRDLVVVGRDDDARELGRAARRFDRPREQRLAADRREVLARDALRAAPRRDQARGRPSVRHPLVDRELAASRGCPRSARPRAVAVDRLRSRSGRAPPAADRVRRSAPRS